MDQKRHRENEEELLKIGGEGGRERSVYAGLSNEEGKEAEGKRNKRKTRHWR